MKILFNNKIFFDQKYGGISRYFTTVFDNLIKKNITFKVIAPIYKNIYLKDLNNLYKKGIFFPRYPLNSNLEKLNNYISNKFINNYNYNIIHDTYFSEHLLNIRNKKKIITVYDMIHEKFEQYYDSKKIIQNRQKILENSDEIICISNSTKEDLLDIYKIPEKKVNVVYFGSDHLDQIKVDREKIESQLINHIHKPFLLYVGKRHRYKNYELLVHAFANSKTLKDNCHIIFFGGETVSKFEMKFYSALGVNKQIFHVNGSDHILKYLYSNAQVMVSTSNYEGFGLNILEAIRLGCKVLAKDIKVFREIFGNKLNYFQDSGDLQNFLEKLNYQKNKNLPNIQIIKDFNWSKTTDETLKIYRK